MSTWFRENDESRRLLAEERLVLAASELTSEALERRGRSRSWLAERLGVRLPEISQRLSGRRNLTLRSLAAMLHELDYGLELRLTDRRPHVAGVAAGGSRKMDWPQSNLRYTDTGHTVRVVRGGQAA